MSFQANGIILSFASIVRSYVQSSMSSVSDYRSWRRRRRWCCGLITCLWRCKYLLHLREKFRLVNLEDKIHASSMIWCKLLWPKMRPSVIGAIVRCIDVHVSGNWFGHQIRPGHDCCCRLIPEWQCNQVVLHKSGVRVVAGIDNPVESSLSQVLVVSDITSNSDGWERRGNRNVSSFRVNNKVQVRAKVLGQSWL